MLKTKWLQGKWYDLLSRNADHRMWRSKHDAVDEIWRAIACSVAAGPLHEAGVKWAAVETCSLATEKDATDSNEVSSSIPSRCSY